MNGYRDYVDGISFPTLTLPCALLSELGMSLSIFLIVYVAVILSFPPECRNGFTSSTSLSLTTNVVDMEKKGL